MNKIKPTKLIQRLEMNVVTLRSRTMWSERGDIEIKDYVSRGEDNQIPPHTLIMDVTMTHDRYGRDTQDTNGVLTQNLLQSRSSSWRCFEKWGQTRIRHYRQLYVERPDPIVFLSVTVNTSECVFVRLLFLYVHREISILDGELPEGSEKFCFLWDIPLTNLEDSVRLILSKTSTMRVTTERIYDITYHISSSS